MKIVYVHQYFTTREGRGGTRSYEFARRLVAKGHEVNVVTTERSTPFRGWRREVIDGINVHKTYIPYNNHMTFSRRILAFIKFAVTSCHKSRSLRGDALVATSTPLTVAIPGIYATTFRSTPFIFEVRDLWPELPIAVGAINNIVVKQLATLLERIAYKNADHIIALSEGMKEGVIRTGYPKQNVTVIPNSSDIDLFTDSHQPGATWRARNPWIGERDIVLYCGTLGHINNVEYLVELAAIAQKKKPSIAFLIVGSGAQENAIRGAATENGTLGVNLFMLPEVAKSGVPELFSASTVTTSLFLPLIEMEANSANKFFDGLAAGRPIAINYGGWQQKILEDNYAGIRLDPHDYSRAAEQLVQLLSSPNELEQMGQNARIVAERDFRRDHLATEFIRVLEESIS